MERLIIHNHIDNLFSNEEIKTKTSTSLWVGGPVMLILKVLQAIMNIGSSSSSSSSSSSKVVVVAAECSSIVGNDDDIYVHGRHQKNQPLSKLLTHVL